MKRRTNSGYQRYPDKTGNSGIAGYQIGEEAIAIRFKERGAYLYNYDRPGKWEVETMKQLAPTGEGLTTFINQYVRDRYAARID